MCDIEFEDVPKRKFVLKTKVYVDKEGQQVTNDGKPISDNTIDKPKVTRFGGLGGSNRRLDAFG